MVERGAKGSEIAVDGDRFYCFQSLADKILDKEFRNTGEGNAGVYFSPGVQGEFIKSESPRPIDPPIIIFDHRKKLGNCC